MMLLKDVIDQNKGKTLNFEYMGGGVVFVTDDEGTLLATVDDDDVYDLLGAADYSWIRNGIIVRKEIK